MSADAPWAVSFALGILALAGCASAPLGRVVRSPAAEPPPAPAAGAMETSSDWHGLVAMPFGTLLKSSPVRLHEVLLFHDEAQAAGGNAAGNSKDCYTVDGAPPRFLGSDTEEYFLCFRYDRLNQIDASVRLAAALAEETFARACASWLRAAAPTAATTATRCEGRDGAIVFSARLSETPDAGPARVSMTLSTAAEREAAGAAPPGP